MATEKYEKHGLTRVEDDILSGFEVESGRIDKVFQLDHYSPEYRLALRSLEAQGLLVIRTNVGEDFHVRNVGAVLTPEGEALWRIRATEER